jgi:ubiquinone/menaquinone biosynthesis C-methylase UbiE
MVNSQTLEETFDQAAPTYDFNGIFTESGRRLVDLLTIKPGAAVLDVATGTGAVLLSAARLAGPSGSATGVDISQNMLQRARQAARSEGLNNVQLQRMDGGKLDFPDASFDAVTCGFGIFFLAATGLGEMYRVCKQGGKIGLTVFDKTIVRDGSPGEVLGQLTKEYGIEFKYTMPLPASFKPEEINSLLADHGFKGIKTVQESEETVSADVEEYWKIIMSAGNRAGVMSLDEPRRTSFKRELFDGLRSIMEPDGLHSRFSVIYAIGGK